MAERIVATLNDSTGTQRLTADGKGMNEPFNDMGETYLHWAAFNGHVNICKSLEAKGADIHLCTSNGGSALYWAAYNGHLDTVKYLISKGAAVDKQNNDGDTALHDAARKGRASVVDFLLQDKSHMVL